MNFTCPFILASGSPRRKKLLEQLGLDFEVLVSDVDESFDDSTPPERIVQELAAAKADWISRSHQNALILAADTLVVRDRTILGKPADAPEAFAMLRSLSGRTHTVYTGIALYHRSSARHVTAFEATRVTFAAMSDDEIRQYVRSGSPMDKAGAYGIQDDQGALYIPRVEGDYYNVVGLPLHRMYQTLKMHFDDLIEN